MTAIHVASPLVVAHMWWDGGWGIVWGLLVAAFWIAVIGAIVMAIRGGDARRDGSVSRSALTVLEERYARGEISREEFLERRAVLTGTGPSA